MYEWLHAYKAIYASYMNSKHWIHDHLLLLAEYLLVVVTESHCLNSHMVHYQNHSLSGEWNWVLVVVLYLHKTMIHRWILGFRMTSRGVQCIARVKLSSGGGATRTYQQKYMHTYVNICIHTYVYVINFFPCKYICYCFMILIIII